MGETFEARDLWASMGLPYQEPDRITPTIISVVRTLIFAARLKIESGLACDAAVTTDAVQLPPRQRHSRPGPYMAREGQVGE